MTSSINYNNIDGTYPVAGVDNDSQGFRTNFTNIRSNFQSAKGEIEDLQNKVILKSALTGTTLNNNMGGAPLNSALISNFAEAIVDLGSAVGSVTLDHSSAHNWSITPSGSFSIGFTNFPSSGQFGRIRLKVVLDNVAKTMTLPSAVSKGIDSIEGLSSNVITFASADTYYFEFVTDDGGTSIHINDLTRPRKFTANTTTWDSPTPIFNRYQYYNATGNFTTNVNNILFIDSTTTISKGNVYLPSPASDGQIAIISTNNAITTLNISSNAGALVLGNVTTLAANSLVKFQFVGSSTPNKWFRH
jgi:hypothetical protein